MRRPGRRSRVLDRLSRAAAIAALALLAACGGYGDDITAVKQADATPGTSNDAWVDEIAGARGQVEWSASKDNSYNNPDIISVLAKIDRPSASGQEHKIELHFIHNRQTKKVALDNVVVDGKTQGLLGGALNLMLLQLQ
jgi:hypothetical protein